MVETIMPAHERPMAPVAAAFEDDEALDGAEMYVDDIY